MLPNLLWLTIWAISVLSTAFGTWTVFKTIRKRFALRSIRTLPPVSILKPLKGIDSDLEENLESFFQLEYPTYELLFCVGDHEDPALEVVRRVIAKHPHIPAYLFIGAQNIGTNPKVNNIFLPYHKASYDTILISDSNVRVTRDYLRVAVNELGPETGMITAVVAGQAAEDFSAQLEATFLNTFYARWMCLTSYFGKTCVIGKSMLFRKSDAERFGGLRTLSRYLAEDYMAGEAMNKLGLRVLVMNTPVNQHIGNYSFHSFWSRHVRWGRIRKAQAFAAFVIEPIFGFIASGILGALSLNHFFGLNEIAVFASHTAIWMFCDYLVALRLNAKFHFLAWFSRELLALPLWLYIAGGNTVLWRGQRLELLPGGILGEKA